MDVMDILITKADSAKIEAAEWRAKHEALLYQYNACHENHGVQTKQFLDFRDEIADHFYDSGATRDSGCRHMYPEICLEFIKQSLQRLDALRSS